MGKALKAAVKIFNIMDEPSACDATVQDDTKINISVDFIGKIEFKDVWFRYPSRKNEWVLRNFNMTINPHENVAIVGESGSGKSTLVALLYRFYDVTFGNILIDGQDIREYDIKQLRA